MSGIGHALLVPALDQHYGAPSGTPEGILRAKLGSSLKNFWQTDAQNVTVVSGGASAIADTAGGKTLIENGGLFAGRPNYSASGGPRNRPFVSFQAVNVGLEALSLGHASGNRLALYCVSKLTPGASQVLNTSFRDGGAGVGNFVLSVDQLSNAFRGRATFVTSGALTATGGASDSGWHLFAVRPLSTGAIFQVDGVTAASFGTSNALVDLAKCHFGHTTVAGGSCAMLMLVDQSDATWAAAQDQAIREYVAAVFGLPDPDGVLRTALGSSLLHWWEPRSDLVTLTGSDVDTLAPLAGAVSFGTRSGSMPYVASGGPGGRPYIAVPTYVGTINALYCLLSIAPANRVAMYTIARFVGTHGANRIVFQTRTSTPIGPTNYAVQCSSGNNMSWGPRLTTSGTFNSQNVRDDNWHLFSVRPLSTGGFWHMDGADGTVTNRSGNTETLTEHAEAQLGQPSTASGGDWAATLLVDMSTNAAQRHAAVAEYLLTRFGLPS